MNDVRGLHHVRALLDRFGGTLPHFIAGRPQAAGDDGGPIVSPVDGRELGRLSEAGDAEVDAGGDRGDRSPVALVGQGSRCA
ncbi:MAG: hypothetical protein U5J97_07970 [Trueperaceae bacterium]|nr:hypothetical protein [Trueperaceae bacterium]